MSKPIQGRAGTPLPAAGWMEASVADVDSGAHQIGFKRSLEPGALVTVRLGEEIIIVRPAALFAAIELIKQKGE